MTYDVAAVRSHFPALEEGANKNTMKYLENGEQEQRKQ